MRRTSFARVVLILWLGVAASPVAATQDDAGEASASTSTPQVVQEAPDRWALAVDFGFHGQVGNTQLVALSSGFQLRHLETQKFEFQLSANYRYGRSRGEIVARSTQMRVTVNARPQARWSPFIFSSADRDRFKRLDLRSSGGGGLQYRFWRSDRGRASLSTAALYDYESFTQPTATAPDGTRHNARWRVLLEAETRIGEQARVKHASSWQPVWDRASDYDVEVTTSFATRVTERVSMTLNHVYQHDSLPAEGVKRDDQRLVAGLRLDL